MILFKLREACGLVDISSLVGMVVLGNLFVNVLGFMIFCHSTGSGYLTLSVL